MKNQSRKRKNVIALAVCLALILVCSFAAQLISSQGGKIKIEQIQIDSRGAMLSADLYYPAGVSDTDSLPAIVVAHGAGVTKGNMRGIAEELARRQFVVLNVNGYGTGLSEMPPNDENDMGEQGLDLWTTPSGMLDAVNFVRTLNFVDPERIGVAGHSQGSRRAGQTAVMDCGYLNFNDIMINVLYDTFGQTFTAEEITRDADALASERLDEEQLAYYTQIRAEKRAEYDTMVKAVCLIGGTAENGGAAQTVEVAGHSVTRNCQVNMALIGGNYDFGVAAFPSGETAKESWHITDGMELENWYVLDDETASSTQLGNIYDLSADSNTDLQDAIENRSTRIICLHPETHSKNFFSVQTARYIVKYFEQVFQYNGGELGAEGASPVDTQSVIFLWREGLNFVAAMAMIAMLAPLAGLLYETKFFVSCAGTNELNPTVYSKKRYWITSVITAVAGGVAIYIVNSIFAPGLPNIGLFPLFPSWWLTPIFLALFAVIAIIQLVVFHLIDKKKYGHSFMQSLNLKMKVTSVLKTLLAAGILMLAAYGTLTVVKYLFNQDFRLWMYAFEEMKVEYWGDVLKYALLMFPQLLLVGAAINYAPRRDIPGWLDELLVVVFNSVGIWVVAIINILLLNGGSTEMFSNFTSTYGFLLSVPVVVFLTRRLYKTTKSIWLGAAVNALLLAWQLTAIGYNIYCAQNWASVFFNV